MADSVVYWAIAETPIGVLRLYGTGRGLLSLALPNETRDAVEARLRRLLGPIVLQEDQRILAAALAQVGAYFAGACRCFNLRLEPRGTPFQRHVWQAVAAVPYGETRTYADIARLMGRPAALRAVGAANGANPLPLIIPCHRIVGTDGSLTGYGGGLATKRWLLDFERRVGVQAG